MSEPSANRARLLLAIAIPAVMALGACAEVAFGWVEPVFDTIAHLFFEIPMLAKIRRPSQLVLLRGHLAAFAVLCSIGAVAFGAMGRHARWWWGVFLVGYAIRAILWIAGGNLPLVPGDSCHYLEVATSIYRGEGPVKHYVESYFRDYPAIRQNLGALDDWATPLYAYVLAVAYRLVGIEPGQNLEKTVGVAKGVSFLLSLLTLPALYAFGRRRFDRETGLGAMAVLAVLPVHAIYAGFGLRESLVALTSVVAVWTLTEAWSVETRRAAWLWAIAAGISAGLAVLARNTALALAAGAGLYGVVRHGRRCAGPLLVWGALLVAVIAPWAWATYREYGQPFYSYTDYFQYNFSWTVHHYDKGITRAADFYTRANAPEIVRVKLKSFAIIVVTSTMILSVPLTLAAFRRIRSGGDTDRLIAWLWVVFVLSTLARVADVTQVAQLGRYYLPLFVLILPTAVAGVRDAWTEYGIPRRAIPWAAATLVALLWSDPSWAYDAAWFGKPYQLHWPALREAGDWVKAGIPAPSRPGARILTWFPWEFRVASNRTTILFPRNYRLQRIDEVIRQYGVTHVLWGSFEPPEHVDPEVWGRYLEQLRIGAGLTDDRELYASPRGLYYPVRLYKVR